MKGTTVLPVDIVGINEIFGGSNALMYAGKPLSWTKDTQELGIEASWGAVYRDTVILGPNNEKLGVYNLTINDLNIPANKATMKAMLQAAATPADSDGDKLPDFWEMQTYGNLSRNGASVEANGLTTLDRYVHDTAGAGGGMPEGLPRLQTLPDGSLSIIYRRRRSSGLLALPQFSLDLTTWETNGTGWEPWSTRTLYNGTCGEVVEWRVLSPGAWRFARVRNLLP